MAYIKAQKSVLGQDIHFVQYEPSQSNHLQKPVIILHGWRQSSVDWREVAERLSAAGHRVIVPDLPGFGDSPKPPDNWGIREYTSCVNELLAVEKLRSPVVVGHSFGGRIGISLAAHYPHSLTSLVLVNSAGFRPSSHAIGAAVGFAKRILLALRLKTFERLARTLLHRMLDVSDYTDSGAMKPIFRNIIAQDLSAEMRNITVPTLIIHGAEDAVVPVARAHKMNKLIAGSELKVIPESGHFLHQEKGLLVSGLILSFLKEVHKK